MRVQLSKTICNFLQKSNNCSRCYSTKPKKTSAKLEDMKKSIGDKGFLRPVKSYAAPADVSQKIQNICASLKISTKNDYTFKTLEEKFQILEACFNDFQYSVPNSQVHDLNTVGDVMKFYETSVNTTVPYDALKQMDLPENLHIQYDYVRFNPENDTKFNGQTAFPKSSTLVTGLKYRGKYEGFEAKQSWP